MSTGKLHFVVNNMKKITLKPKPIAKTFFNFLKTCIVKSYRNIVSKCSFMNKTNALFYDLSSQITNDDLEPQKELVNIENELKNKDIQAGHFFIVLTDIVDSTHQWDQHEDEMKELIVWHHNLGENLIDKYNGYEVRREGDSFFVAFKDSEKAAGFAKNFNHEINNRCENQLTLKLSLEVRIIAMKCKCVLFLAEERYIFYGNDIDKIYELSNSVDNGEIRYAM